MKHLKNLSLILIIIGFSSCALVSKFDQGSLDSDMLLKKEALALIQHAGEPASDYSVQIAALNSDLSSMIAKEKGKGKKNFAIQKQWDILTSPDHLLGKLLKDWQAGKPMSKTYIDEESSLISDVWDQIIESEASKIH